MPTAFIAGASGLVGRHLLRELLARGDYERVVAFVRRPLGVADPRLVEVTTDFTALDRAAEGRACDDAFCCLGTTRWRAGSRESFRAVDHGAVLAFAWAARRAGAQRFFLVSALGANSASRLFYPRVKGETEEALYVLGFRTLAIFRPSLLLGRREEFRLGETLSAALLWFGEPLLRGPLRKYRAIGADVVARAMVRCSFGRQGQGVLVFPSDEIQDLGGSTA
ncbi:MAG TPA: oxidoreductase [Lacunisphaera sp.]|nr:oxidoreductase [Lacunisphaera sp.]